MSTSAPLRLVAERLLQPHHFVVRHKLELVPPQPSLSRQAIRVLVQASLPRVLQTPKVEQAHRSIQLCVPCGLLAVVRRDRLPPLRTAQLLISLRHPPRLHLRDRLRPDPSSRSCWTGRRKPKTRTGQAWKLGLRESRICGRTRTDRARDVPTCTCYWSASGRTCFSSRRPSAGASTVHVAERDPHQLGADGHDGGELTTRR